jgi:hypothetical protein
LRIFQTTQKVWAAWGNLRILCYSINFWQIIEVEKFSFLLKVLGTRQILCSERFFYSRMLGNILGYFANFSMTRKVISIEFFISAQKNWAFWKSPNAQTVWAF